MPTTRKQKKTIKSRGSEMLSYIENLDIMLGENHFNRNKRDESLSSNRARRPESAIEDEFENKDENRHLDPRDVPMSITAVIQRRVILVQRSIDRQLSRIRACLGNWTK